jgi:phage tail sheath gpL-like
MEATASFDLLGTATPQDYIELAWLDQHFNYLISGSDTMESAVSGLAAIITANQATAAVSAMALGTTITLTERRVRMGIASGIWNGNGADGRVVALRAAFTEGYRPRRAVIWTSAICDMSGRWCRRRTCAK